MHLDLIGGFTPNMREADDACFAQARLMIDTEEALLKSGDLLSPMSRGVFTANETAAVGAAVVLAYGVLSRRLSWLGQSEPVSDDLRVHDLVMLARLPHQGWLSAPSAQDAHMVEAALKATQAWDWRERTLGELSGGERQRVLLARAMAGNAPTMLMDEPLANLDPPHQVDWLEQVHCLLAQGTTVVSVLHEIGMALHADQMVVMAQGRVQHQGACDDARTHQSLEQVFDHRSAIHPLGDQGVALPR